MKNDFVAASEAILNYLNKQNRPYSAVDIFNNLHKEYGKTVCGSLTFLKSSFNGVDLYFHP